ncbi:hypothetical protein [Streptomyces sp. NPDC058382]|uniref:hypothetical protein n=1 Tax=unclassified Streptomyces TaxID=2593676 RepID=UPI003636AA59
MRRAVRVGTWLRTAQQDFRLRERRGHERLRAEGERAGSQLVFTDRLMATLVVLTTVHDWSARDASVQVPFVLREALRRPWRAR